MVAFLECFRPYFLGRQFTICTDYGALTQLQTTRANGICLQNLQEFNFSVVDHPEKQQSNADGMLKIPWKTSYCAVQMLVLSYAVQRASQLADSAISLILQSKETEQKAQTSAAYNIAYRSLAQLWNQGFYQVIVGQDDKPRNHFQLVVFVKLREEVLETLHRWYWGTLRT